MLNRKEFNRLERKKRESEKKLFLSKRKSSPSKSVKTVYGMNTVSK